ncbi:hypothetical protein BDQ12DRAFT_686937 [Crucibulum laeve]|uniref:Uncharacterized protein n=1 Tax=Crucibulum laeve TaxID=68775 RepID=A0A5C3LTE1_9AGAR|nr:hypothetical protein BDQ12DRAFT_686937 [Crucibulum laeve]
MELGVTSCWVIATTASSFLFLRRVQAVYRDSKIVLYIFIFLYVANIGTSLLAPIGSHSGPLANTGYCVNTGIERYVSAGVFVSLAYDSLVFLAISYRMAVGHAKRSEKKLTWRTVLTGSALPHISRAVFQGGQQYYLVTVGANILILILIVTPSIPPVYQATFTTPSIALTSSMTCRVFRDLKFAVEEGRQHLSTIEFGGTGESNLTEGTSTTAFGSDDNRTVHDLEMGNKARASLLEVTMKPED